MKYWFGEAVGVAVRNHDGSCDFIEGVVIDNRKFLFMERYRVQWKIQNSWDGAPPFWYSYKSKWFSPKNITKLNKDIN